LKNWNKEPAIFKEKPVWADSVAADFKKPYLDSRYFFSQQYLLFVLFGFGFHQKILRPLELQPTLL
jgi:hypothetical protein